MPLPSVDWPVRLKHFVIKLQIISDHTDKKCCRMDIEVDAETLRLLNEFETHARHRQVQIPLADGAGCIRGEKASDPAKSSRVRISLHDVSTGECSDEPIRS